MKHKSIIYRFFYFLIFSIISFILIRSTGILDYQTFLKMNVWFFSQFAIYGVVMYSIQKLSSSSISKSIQKLQVGFGTFTIYIVPYILLLSILFYLEDSSSILRVTKTVLYAGIWLIISFITYNGFTNNNFSNAKAAVCLILAALSINFVAFDWFIPSIGVGVSTIFPWYIISILLASGSAMYICYIFLMPSRIHCTDDEKSDLSKFLFAFSLLWGYMWFENYLITWNANIPTNTIYFVERFINQPFLHYVIFVFGFIVPVVLLFSKKMKGNTTLMIFASMSVLLAHYLEMFFIFNKQLFVREYFFVNFFILFSFIYIFLLSVQLTSGRSKAKWGRWLFVLVPLLFACTSNETSGRVYYPDMFYKVADENPQPTVKGTVPTTGAPYRYTKDNELRTLAGKTFTNAFANDSITIAAGRKLFETNCTMCHGNKGDGKGFLYVSGKFNAAPRSLLSESVKNAPDGEIFHTITVGFNLMMAHGAQLSVEERWKVVGYIKSLKTE